MPQGFTAAIDPRATAMNRMTPILLALAFAATGVACGKKEAPAAPAPVAAPVVLLTAPTGNDTEAWKAYLKQELTPFIDKRYRRPYIYFIPMVDETAADKDAQQAQYEAQMDNVGNAIGRGIQAGSMVAFGGPDSNKVLEVIVEAFKLASPKALKGVRVVVVADPAIQEAAATAVAPSEAEFKFVEMK